MITKPCCFIGILVGQNTNKNEGKGGKWQGEEGWSQATALANHLMVLRAQPPSCPRPLCVSSNSIKAHRLSASGGPIQGSITTGTPKYSSETRGCGVAKEARLSNPVVRSGQRAQLEQQAAKKGHGLEMNGGNQAMH